jgi:hypothetical protein
LTEPRDGLPEGHTIWHVGPNDTHP